VAAKRSTDWLLGARSETGYVRSVNEDRMAWAPTAFGHVLVLADGMGGYQGGAQAAEITVQTLKDRLSAIPAGSGRFGDQIRKAFSAANREVFSRRNPQDPSTREMGATGLALVTCGSRAMVAHVGDSRAYLWRRGAALRQLTADHTLVQSMVDTGILTLGEAAAHPDASVLDRAIGHQSSVQADVSDWIDLQPGDTVLLCSDGLCGYVSDAEIEAVLRADDDPQSATDRLVECALNKGGHDNVTVQLARYEPENGGLAKRVVARPVMMIPVLVVLAGVGAYVIGGRLAQPSVAEAGRLSARLAEANQRIEQLQRAAPTAVTAAVASSVAAGVSPPLPASAASPSSPSAKPKSAPAVKPKPVSKPGAVKEAEKKSATDPDATQAAGRNPGDEPHSGANTVPRESAAEVPAPVAPVDKPAPGGDSVPLPDPVP
jgi:serine/threonine protein phosphatase PrpC